ncbi:MAG: 50S ribosome-binding GTPase, partial [Proteobacteria bacterium]|nr:50S ribosome-binding GTPase [Pseudomonadota bacterium]
AEPGWPGQERWLWLRLKLIADVGLVGLPNAGKSTFLSRVTRAKPKIGDYPFTTLHPNLGVVGVGDKEFVIADLPGLIEGAHEGVGLGDRFLGHAERCACMLHLVDGTSGDVAADYATVREELDAYGNGLETKAVIVALNKVDAIDEETLEIALSELREASGGEVMVISGVSGAGVEPLLFRLLEHVEAARAARNGEDAA